MLPFQGAVLFIYLVIPRRCHWVDIMLPFQGADRMVFVIPRALTVWSLLYPVRCPWVDVMLPLQGVTACYSVG